MGKVILSIVAVVACLVAVESLTCNTCSFSVVGFCMNPSTENCPANVTQCYTSTLKFPNVTNFNGFRIQGCTTVNETCGISISNSLLGVSYTSEVTCCNTDKCNTIAVSGATTTKMTFTAAIGGAILASMLGSMV